MTEAAPTTYADCGGTDIENLTVTLPEDLRRHVEERAAAGFESAVDFIRNLVERDRREAADIDSQHDRFAAAVREALASGTWVEADDSWWAKKDAEYARKFGHETGS